MEIAAVQFRWQTALKLGLLAFLLAFLYRKVLGHLAIQWMNDEDFSHGAFVPVFTAFVLWRERQRFAQLKISPSWAGLFVSVLALGMLVGGVFGAELFLSRSSFVVLLAGLVIYFLGWEFFRAALFPWAFLFLMIPIPKIIFNKVAIPLQFIASSLATAQMQLMGVPVLREGNIIHLPSMSLEVVEACSGIRSLMTLGTLAIIYGYFLETRLSRRVVLALASVPIAVVANAWRVTGTGLLGQYWDPDKAQGFFHTFSGWLIFVLALILLFLFHSVMSALERWWERRRAKSRVS